MSISSYPAGRKGANYKHSYPHDPCANNGHGQIYPETIRPGPPYGYPYVNPNYANNGHGPVRPETILPGSPPYNGYPHVNPNYANNGHGQVRPKTILPGGPPYNGYPNNPNYANNGHGPIHSENVVNDPADYASTDNAYLISQKIKWKETETEHIFKVELPGVKKEDVTVDMEGNRFIRIVGEKWVDNTDVPRRRTEGTCVKVPKSFRLPDDSKPLLTKASMENGVLTVRVPRQDIRMRSNLPSVRIPVL